MGPKDLKDEVGRIVGRSFYLHSQGVQDGVVAYFCLSVHLWMSNCTEIEPDAILTIEIPKVVVGELCVDVSHG